MQQGDFGPILVEQLPAKREALRIAVVTETYPPEVNGVALTAARFVEGLCARGHRVLLARPAQRGESAGSEDGALRQVLVRGAPIPRYPDLRMGLPAKRALTQLWSLHRPDLVHIVTEGPLGWSALQAAAKLKLPVCSDFRTNFHAYSGHYGAGWLRRPILAYLRKFHNRTLATLVPTEAMRSELGALGFRNLQVVSRGVDTRRFAPEHRDPALRAAWGLAEDDVAVLHVGRLAAEKNMPALAGAYEAIRARVPRARLVLVGDGPARETMRARCPDAIFAGMRAGADLAAHYASADMFVFPSITETFGNVTLEAMASGLAVVAFDYAAAAEHIRHGVSGLLAPFGDAASLAAQAGTIATEPVRLRALGAQARCRALTLDWERVVEQLETIFAGLSAADGPG